ncbi:hypothetical protein EZV62_010271 [Acer yangbiense]|uniref:Uncharacterized protein n=1 Tax=Acer yangbiense TaxID=1000413 RepID=A0A5C7I1T1_9ROSI|nr:hypothetical protein EZV62_010271 [Acer yangbiense]
MDLEIAKLYENLSLADEDVGIHEIPEEVQQDGVADVDRCLMGKVLSGKKPSLSSSSAPRMSMTTVQNNPRPIPSSSPGTYRADNGCSSVVVDLSSSRVSVPPSIAAAPSTHQMVTRSMTASNDPVLLRASGNGLIKKCQSHFHNTSKVKNRSQ